MVSILLGFKSIWPLSTRGPVDLLPRSSPIASLTDTPLIPRIETLLGLLAKITIELGIHKPSSTTSNPEDVWENIVADSLAELLGSSRIEVYGPFLRIKDKYYVNVGKGILRIGDDDSIVKEYVNIGVELIKTLRESRPRQFYENSINMIERIRKLVLNNLLEPPSMFMTGIALERELKSVRHGLIYSYVLRDYASIGKGSYEVLLLIKADDIKGALYDLKRTVVQLGPRGRPAEVVVEDIEDSSLLAKLVDCSNQRGCTGLIVSLAPISADDVEADRVSFAHPLGLKPLIIPLAKTTGIEVNGRLLWVKTSLKPSLQPGTVVKVNDKSVSIGCERISSGRIEVVVNKAVWVCSETHC